LFGAKNKNSEVFARHTIVATHFIFSPLLKEQSLQQATILFGELIQSLPHFFLHFPSRNDFNHANGGIENRIDDFVIGWKLSAPQSIMLIEYVVAYRIDESPEAFRLMNALFRHESQDTREGLLPNIFYRSNRPQTLACLQPNQFTEISNEMLLGPEIAGTKPVQVSAIEILKLY
jgi:hypothetical protein